MLGCPKNGNPTYAAILSGDQFGRLYEVLCCEELQKKCLHTAGVAGSNPALPTK